MPGMANSDMTAKECIESCWQCHVVCLETQLYCLDKGGAHASTPHISLMTDCAEMCVTTANAMLRRSSRHAAVCVACAEICDACAQACEALAGDATMIACARSCRECAGHCREMSKRNI